MPDINLWSSPAHARSYLALADAIPKRAEGERSLLEWVPASAVRVLDLGSGDGRLLASVLDVLPAASGIALDFSDEMLARVRSRFAGDARVSIAAHNLDVPLPDLGTFDAVVSSFAIHHVNDRRKQALYAEVFQALTPGGVFCNLEHVASPTRTLHEAFLRALNLTPEEDDPSNKLCEVETQLRWLRDLGFADVDCQWKWRELALLCGRRPAC